MKKTLNKLGKIVATPLAIGLAAGLFINGGGNYKNSVLHYVSDGYDYIDYAPKPPHEVYEMLDKKYKEEYEQYGELYTLAGIINLDNEDYFDQINHDNPSFTLKEIGESKSKDGEHVTAGSITFPIVGKDGFRTAQIDDIHRVFKNNKGDYLIQRGAMYCIINEDGKLLTHEAHGFFIYNGELYGNLGATIYLESTPKSFREFPDYNQEWLKNNFVDTSGGLFTK